MSGGAADSVIPPALQELRQVFEMVRTTQLVQLEAFVSYCTNAGTYTGAVHIQICPPCVLAVPHGRFRCPAGPSATLSLLPRTYGS